ncbi:MAG: DUF4169 family protein [Sphingobium sp.]
MGDVVNLRMARKAKKRSEAEALAATNRALHGRTKAQKQADAAEKARADRTLDGAKREP